MLQQMSWPRRRMKRKDRQSMMPKRKKAPAKRMTIRQRTMLKKRALRTTPRRSVRPSLSVRRTRRRLLG
jgi:hypothetical protein